MKTIKTKKGEVVETIHRIKIKDPYRWLENGNDPEVKKWVELQNRRTDKALGSNSKRDLIREEILKYLKMGWIGIPTPKKEYYFWEERRGDENQPVLYFKKGLKGKKKELVNPNKLNPKGTTSIVYWHPSQNGKYVAYGLTEGGSELSTTYVIEVETSRKLKDKIPYERWSTIGWLPDESGFFYTRYPKPGTVPKGEEGYYERIYFHKLGGHSEKDILIFGEELPREDMITFRISKDGKYLAIMVWKGWTKNDIYLYDIENKRAIPVIQGLDFKFYALIHRGKLYLLTNYKAPNFKLIEAEVNSLPKSIEEWNTIIPESGKILESFIAVSDNLVVTYLHKVTSLLEIYDLKGNKKGEIKLPILGYLGWLGGERDGNEFFYQFQTFTRPEIIYRYDLKTKEISVFGDVGKKVDHRAYTSYQVWYESKDKTKIPMFIFHKRNLKKNKNNPLLLYGYGGFGTNLVPGFYKNLMPFIDRGGAIAVANIRGGGEFGEKWHREGILSKKQNTFDDFISAAEYLIKEEYTNSNRLAIMGGSNGGLLVGACMVQRPDLFKAVVCSVPLLDMVRFHKFLIAARWVFEYGNPDNPKDFSNIIRWSPYHNVKKETEYPAVLFTTAFNDTRVEPFHARKMCALLESINKNNPVLLRTEIEVGHSNLFKSQEQTAEGYADILAFIYWQLGVYSGSRYQKSSSNS